MYVMPSTIRRIKELLESGKVSISAVREKQFIRAAKNIVLGNFDGSDTKTCIIHTLERVLNIDAIKNRVCPYCGKKAKTARGLLVHLVRSNECSHRFRKDVLFAAAIYSIAMQAKTYDEDRIVAVDKALEIAKRIGFSI